jgi:GNAT superfamily N-acetyltransferase
MSAIGSTDLIEGVITVRAATREDMSAIDRVLAESYCRLLKTDYRPSTIVMAVPIIARANPVLVRSGTYYVAEAGSHGIVGAGGWMPSQRVPGAAEIRHFVTDHRHLRRGIARRLMQEVVRQASFAGIRRLDCLATRNGAAFYKAQGFSSRSEVTMMLGPAVEFPVVPMRKDLQVKAT